MSPGNHGGPIGWTDSLQLQGQAQGMLGDAGQKANGIYYTPQPIVRYIVERTIGPLLQDHRLSGEPLRVLDPACGDGAFLAEAYRFLAAHRTPMPGTSLERAMSRSAAGGRRVLLDQVFGVDTDVAAVRLARKRLAAMAEDLEPAAERSTTGPTGLERGLRRNLRGGDAMLGPGIRNGGIRSVAWDRDFRQVFRGPCAGFDAVVGNPPYVNIRVLARTRDERIRAYLREHYRCAFRGFDLYVLFLEKAFQLLRPGGRCGMIVPNKIATLDYALPCRRMLLEQTSLCEILDVSDMRAFPDVGVYPYILIWEKRVAAAGHRVTVGRAGRNAKLSSFPRRRGISQASWSAESGFLLQEAWDLEGRVATQPLGTYAEIHGGTAGFAAGKMARSLAERGRRAGEDYFEFVVSGSIDRYALHLGGVRFMNQYFARPVLPSDCAWLSPNKRKLFRGPKVVLAGMVRRLEAAWDAGGLALGVQVYAVAGCENPWFLLGLLNSKLLSYLFRLRFSAKRLGGSFLAVNKGQLAQLPVRIVQDRPIADARRVSRLCDLVPRMIQLETELLGCSTEASRGRIQRVLGETDREIDQLVYELYRLTPREIRRVESAAAGW